MNKHKYTLDINSYHYKTRHKMNKSKLYTGWLANVTGSDLCKIGQTYKFVLHIYFIQFSWIYTISFF